MPKRKAVPRLESQCLYRFCEFLSSICTKLEEEEVEGKSGGGRGGDCRGHIRFIERLPGPVLEAIIPQTLKSITSSIRKNRSHKGLLKALEILIPVGTISKLDIGALFTGVRLYGQVNSSCKFLLQSGFKKLSNLSILNLSSKCDDAMLLELAKYCPNLKDLNVPLSDITDRGLMILSGISLTENNVHGCLELIKLGIHNCYNVSLSGAASVLRNLKQLQYLYYDKLADAVDIVTKIDGDYISGRKVFNITHLDQFADYYDFSNEEIIDVILKVCPNLESLRFFTSDDGCAHLSRLRNIKYLQLETEEPISQGFEKLTKSFKDLVSLQMTFRFMPQEQMMNIAKNLKHLEILRLIGFEIQESYRLIPDANTFRRLRVIDIRMIKQQDFDEGDDDEDEDEDQDTITPQLIRFFLEYTETIEDLSLAAVAAFIDEEFIRDLLRRNPRLAKELRRLNLSITPSSKLTIDVAKLLIDSCPNLNAIAISRWKIQSSELKQLRNSLKSQNYDLNFIY